MAGAPGHIPLDLPSKALGQVAGGRDTRTGRIDVALLQSLQRKGEVKDLVAEYGHVIVDECHHLSAFRFEQVLRQVRAKFVVGLTATPTRKRWPPPRSSSCSAVLSDFPWTLMKPFAFAIPARSAASRSRISDAHGTHEIRNSRHFARGLERQRNQLIVGDILDAVHRGRNPLVLSSRTDHLDRLAEGLSGLDHALILKGGMGKKQWKAIAERLASIPEGTPRVLLATGWFIWGGFDDSRLDTLFLTMPISWRGTLQQYVGRPHRLHEGKNVVRVFDYVNTQVPMLARMCDKRLKGYRALGYELESGDLSFSEACAGTIPPLSEL